MNELEQDALADWVRLQLDPSRWKRGELDYGDWAGDEH